MKQDFSFQHSSRLSASPVEIWQHATSMAGVNAELMPLARMSFPKNLAAFSSSAVALGKPLFYSWILLFGFLPVDYHALTFKEIDNQHFLEHSSSFLHRKWEHERSLEETADGTIVMDRLSFQTRIPFLGYLLLPIYRYIFQHRHAKLRQLFKATAIKHF